MSIDRYTDHSVKIQTNDIDWAAGARAGLTETEKFMLGYFSDIEYQTVMYMRDLLHTKAIEDPDMVSFLCMWNYEEHFHGQALSRLLEDCGASQEKSRIANTRKKVTLHEKITGWGAALFSRIFTHHYPALFMTWGAINELTTLRAYERLEEMTQNPVLKILCQRIAKQERRHFAWYHNKARETLSRSIRTQKITRFVLERFWTPVGEGVKTPEEVSRLIQTLFEGKLAYDLAVEVDEKASSLPGLEGMNLMKNRFLKILPNFSSHFSVISKLAA